MVPDEGHGALAELAFPVEDDERSFMGHGGTPVTVTGIFRANITRGFGVATRVNLPIVGPTRQPPGSVLPHFANLH